MGQGYFTGNACPSSADADTIVESLGREGNDMFEYRVSCPERGWQEYLRARGITQKDGPSPTCAIAPVGRQGPVKKSSSTRMSVSTSESSSVNDLSTHLRGDTCLCVERECGIEAESVRWNREFPCRAAVHLHCIADRVRWE
ncbi:hypothetical protein CPI83_30535 (plasmid) [Rhodococcus sp. H-CA8f]|nr:hypothetical protein CPI83_30535 [Rhodococcus sp. H-CA8f]